MARRSRRPSASRVPYFAVGLALGLAVAAGVYFSDLRSGSGVPTASSREPRAPTERTPQQRAPAPAERSGAAAPAPAASASGRSGGAAAAQRTEPSYEFYDVLPQYEVVVPDPAPRSSAARPSAAQPPVAEPGSYVLQTGSFRSHADADRMQANLALLGVESRIQTVAIDNADYHRVRVGPVSDLDELNRIRSVLNHAGIESLVMKAP